jgi:hypothetical protein
MNKEVIFRIVTQKLEVLFKDMLLPYYAILYSN